MSWLDGENMQLPPAQPAHVEPTFGETFGAAVTHYNAADAFDTRNYYAQRLGSDVIAALRKKGKKGFTIPDGRQLEYDEHTLRSDYVLASSVQPRLWEDVQAEQRRDPSFLPGLRDAASFDAAILKARRADYDASGAALADAHGAGGFFAGLAGGLWAGAHDPAMIGSTLITAPVGGAITTRFAGLATSYAKKMLLGATAEGVANVLGTAPAIPISADHSAEIGVDYTAGDAASQLGMAFAFGAATHGVIAGVPAAARAVRALPDNPRVARATLKAITWKHGGLRELSPEERDAVRVWNQHVEDVDSSPFVPTQEGDQAHAERLRYAVEAMARGTPVPAMPIVGPNIPELKTAPKPRSIGRIGAGFGGEDLVGGGEYQIDARALGVDPERFQFKSGGDRRGVTGSLDISQWSDEQSGKLLVWQDNAGKLWVANGHQRTGKAMDLMAGGHDPITLTAQVVREADGVSAEEAMIRGAIINIGENATTPLLDAAKVARLAPGRLEGRIPSRVMRNVNGLARLSGDAWGMVKNGTIDPAHASLIGQIAEDPKLHAPLVALLHETKPATAREAEFTIRDALSAGSTTEEQFGLFGSDPVQTLLVKRRSQIISSALAKLRADKRFTATAVAGEKFLTDLGNNLDRDANATATAATEQLLTLIERLATLKGSFVNTALRDAAEQAAKENSNAAATRIFVERLRAHPDLVRDALAGGEGAVGDLRAGAYSPEQSGQGGSGADAGIGPGLAVNTAGAERSLTAFDDPSGAGAIEQADTLRHDLDAMGSAADDPNIAAKDKQRLQLAADAPNRAGVAQADLTETGLFGQQDMLTASLFDMGDGRLTSVKAVLDAQDSEAAAIKAVRDCL